MPQRDKLQVLKLQAPRAGRTWLVLASLCAALGSAAGYLSDVPAHWQRVGGTSLALFAVVLLVWRFLPASRLVFDPAKQMVLKDGRRIARFAEIDSVQIVLPASDDGATYLVELRRPGAPAILVGCAEEEVEAQSIAARVAGAIGRPVGVTE